MKTDTVVVETEVTVDASYDDGDRFLRKSYPGLCDFVLVQAVCINVEHF